MARQSSASLTTRYEIRKSVPRDFISGQLIKEEEPTLLLRLTLDSLSELDLAAQKRQAQIHLVDLKLIGFCIGAQ
jgi:hypothetical protein